MLIHVLFIWIVQISFRSFVDSVCGALLMCLFALQCRYYLRWGAGNIASDQTYLCNKQYVIKVFITYLPRDPRTEPNRAESPQLSRAGPRVPNRTKTSRVSRSSKLSLETSRAQLIGLTQLRAQVNPSQAESSTEVSSTSSQAGSQTKLSRSLTPSKA